MSEDAAARIKPCKVKRDPASLGGCREATQFVGEPPDPKVSMMYWHERAMRVEGMLVKLVEALEHKTALLPAFVEARDLIARGFSDNGEAGQARQPRPG
jgi:hypothetical protein